MGNRESQLVIEVLTAPFAKARESQLVIEVLRYNTAANRVQVLWVD